MPDGLDAKVLCWQPNITKTFKEEFEALLKHKGLKIFVMNVEALSSEKGSQTAVWFGHKFGEKGIMVIDESTSIKNRKANRTKSVVACGEYFKFRRLLTGSPVTKSPMDLYSQCEFLGAELLNFKSYYAFKVATRLCRSGRWGIGLSNRLSGFNVLTSLTRSLIRLALAFSKRTALIFRKRFISGAR